jgi:hypothetical protein
MEMSAEDEKCCNLKLSFSEKVTEKAAEAKA